MQLNDIRLQGAIVELITDLFRIDDGFSAGQKMTQLEKTAKKRFFDMTDLDFYNSLNDTIQQDYYTDTFEDEPTAD